MSRRRPLRFLAISLPGAVSPSASISCSVCHMEARTIERCYLCGKAVCTLHRVSRTLERLGRAVLCEGCDLVEIRHRLRRGLEDQAKSLSEAIGSLTPVLEGQRVAGLEAVEILIRQQEEQRIHLKTLRQQKARLQELHSSSQIQLLKTAIAAEESNTLQSNQQSHDLEREVESLRAAQFSEERRLCGLQCELQEYQRRLRHSLPPAQVQSRCCPRCKSQAQRAFKGLDFFPSRLDVYDSQFLPPAQLSSTQPCALF